MGKENLMQNQDAEMLNFHDFRFELSIQKIIFSRVEISDFIFNLAIEFLYFFHSRMKIVFGGASGMS